MSEKKTYCIYCGSLVEKDATFCPNCGAALAKPAPTTSTPTTSGYQPPSPAIAVAPNTQAQTPFQAVTVVQTQSPPPKQDDSLGMFSLIAGILSWVLLPGILSIVAIILGHISLSRRKNGLAKAGLILGYIQIGLLLAYLILWLILFM